MDFKRITIISGHYGSGKTNIAVSLSLDLKKQHENTAIADIDIVNPYFRTKDSEDLLNKNGIRLICSKYANSNVDIPALPQEMYAVTDDKTLYSILDVGGDERGALALGRLVPKIQQENNYEMIYVVNKYRPLTSTPESAIEVMTEIEQACRLKFTSIINNSNLGKETDTNTVLLSVPFVEEVAKRTGLPIAYTTVYKKLLPELEGKIKNLYPINLQKYM